MLTLRNPYLLLPLAVVLAGVVFLCWPISDALLGQRAVTSTQVLASNGELLREIRPAGSGLHVAMDAINPHVIDAVVAVEDRYFYDHFGINPLSIVRALRDNMAAGAIVGGGSTLTMQVARALRGASERTLYQKIAEALLALRLEVRLEKDDILQLWLNRVYFGNQAYGIEAAALLYFQKPAIDLTLPEAAFLAGLPQRPNAYNPYRHLEPALHRQHRVLDAMVVAGYISREEAETSKHIALHLMPPAQTFRAPHFVHFLQRTSPDAFDRATSIQTTLDLPLQTSIEALVRAHLERLGNDRASNAAVIVIDNKTGALLAYVGSADYWNDAIEGQNDGITMLRQPGSALKPFTYAVALSSGAYTPASILPDIEIHIPEAGGAFSPLNYDKKFHGPVPFRTALASSYNVPAVRLVREYGASALIDMLQNTGITSLNRGPEHYGVGLTLGNGEVQLLELARAYATLARQGKPLALRPLSSLSYRDESTAYPARAPAGSPVLMPEVAFLITDILQDPEARAPAFGRYGPLELPFPVAVKTGTSKDYRDNWAVGYSPAHTVGVWVGNFDGQPMRRVSGVSGAGPLFHAVMQLLGPGGEFEKPAAIQHATICPVSGRQPGAHCPGVKKEYFLAGTVPADTCDIHQQYDIDTRTGVLADATTPARFTDRVLFTVYPDIYHRWAHDNGIPRPPGKINRMSPETAPEKPLLEVTYPKSSMTFQLDPILKPAYQQIRLEGLASTTLENVSWQINGQRVAGPVNGTFWPLREGDHTIILSGETSAGAAVTSAAVTIKVLAARVMSSNEGALKTVTPTSR